MIDPTLEWHVAFAELGLDVLRFRASDRGVLHEAVWRQDDALVWVHVWAFDNREQGRYHVVRVYLPGRPWPLSTKDRRSWFHHVHPDHTAPVAEARTTAAEKIGRLTVGLTWQWLVIEWPADRICYVRGVGGADRLNTPRRIAGALEPWDLPAYVAHIGRLAEDLFVERTAGTDLNTCLINVREDLATVRPVGEGFTFNETQDGVLVNVIGRWPPDEIAFPIEQARGRSTLDMDSNQ